MDLKELGFAEGPKGVWSFRLTPTGVKYLTVVGRENELDKDTGGRRWMIQVGGRQFYTDDFAAVIRCVYDVGNEHGQTYLREQLQSLLGIPPGPAA